MDVEEDVTTHWNVLVDHGLKWVSDRRIKGNKRILCFKRFKRRFNMVVHGILLLG